MMIKNCSWTSLSIITGHGAQSAFCHSEQKDFVSSRNDFCVIWFFFMFYSQVESGMLILLNQPTGDASNGCQYSREHLSQIILWFWCFVFGVLMCDGEFSLWDQAHSISFGPSSLVYFRWILRINSSVSMWFISFDSTAVAFNSDPCGINDIIMYRTSCQHTFFTNGAPGGLRQLESRHVTLLCVVILWKNPVFWSLWETLGWAGQTALPDRLLQGRRVLDPITVCNVWFPGAVVCTRGGQGRA